LGTAVSKAIEHGDLVLIDEILEGYIVASAGLSPPSEGDVVGVALESCFGFDERLEWRADAMQVLLGVPGELETVSEAWIDGAVKDRAHDVEGGLLPADVCRHRMSFGFHLLNQGGGIVGERDEGAKDTNELFRAGDADWVFFIVSSGDEEHRTDVHFAVPVPVEGEGQVDRLFTVLVDVEHVGDGFEQLDYALASFLRARDAGEVINKLDWRLSAEVAVGVLEEIRVCFVQVSDNEVKQDVFNRDVGTGGDGIALRYTFFCMKGGFVGPRGTRGFKRRES
jgi:hypothetical protein